MPAGFFLPFADRGLLLLTRSFAMLLGNARKSGGPAPLEPSFKVERDSTHGQCSGFVVAPRVKGLNARDPLKVHPKCRLGGIRASSHAVAGVDRHMTARQIPHAPGDSLKPVGGRGG